MVSLPRLASLLRPRRTSGPQPSRSLLKPGTAQPGGKPGKPATVAPKALSRATSKALSRTASKALIFGLRLSAELIPGIRMSPTQHKILPANMGAGFLGAEIATWWALSPSLLPRPWWVQASNLAVLQTVGHASATAIHSLLPHPRRGPLKHLNRGFYTASHLVIGATTAITTIVGLRRQNTQNKLLGVPHTTLLKTAGAIMLGTAGYGIALLSGEVLQLTIYRLRILSRHILPSWVRWLSWPLSVVGLTAALVLLSNRVFLRRMLNKAARQAAYLNQLIFPGTEQPWEPERSGSPWSYESWSAVGSQGRAVLSGGPRRTDIASTMGFLPTEVHEPIRVFAGLVPGRSPQEQVRLIIAELHRTGAFRRDIFVIHTSTGTGWITDWSVDTVEFLSAGNCVNISMQYSYLPSALSWYKNNEAPINAARLLIDAVRAELAQLPTGAGAPRLYLAGESLGAYGTAAAYGRVEKLLEVADGVLLSGTPRFSDAMQELVAARDAESSQRMPVFASGKHIRFVATPKHLHTANEWEFPRMIVAHHISDPIVWWDLELFIRQPEWLKHPAQDHVDVFPRLRWLPFVTGWQVALDMASSVTVPGGHGHNYHAEFIDYWAAMLGDLTVTEQQREKIVDWIRSNSIKR
ncbi:alpha/beta-hydrolase family protein [Corynebacterium callunae]|uniref:alpha/beta-hydrolase family protein n=1 Tax=Corynebacterium callunae TaxID=1721 RepID=UPI003981A5B6